MAAAAKAAGMLRTGEEYRAGPRDAIEPRFGDRIDRHIRRVLAEDIFPVSADTDPKRCRYAPVNGKWGRGPGR
jgi:hypothetical protein